jgi:uncharacterized damage-inducible protein DinB
MQYTVNVSQEDTEHENPHGSGYRAIAQPLKRFGRPARRLLPAALLCLLLPASVALAQEPQKSTASANPGNPLSASTKVAYGFLKAALLRSAEKMPEEQYNFRPTWIVRSFGHIIGHVADAQYMFCSMVRGEKNPAISLRIERTKTSKADLIAALKDAFAYCDKVYDGMTDAAGSTEMVKFRGFDAPKLFMLTANNMHTIEHYGNLIVYLRMKNIVPPSSEPEFMPQPQK